MKKTIAILLAVVMTASSMSLPAFAASPGDAWAGYVSRWNDWFAQLHEPDAPEAPAESSAQAEQETPEAAEEYSIRYDANGGYFWSQYASPAISRSKSYKVTSGNTHKVISAPQRTGYTFCGWEDTDGNLYHPGDKITPDKDMSMKAIWK